MSEWIIPLGMAMAALGLVISIVDALLNWRKRHDKHK